jgi:hypothetical protein
MKNNTGDEPPAPTDLDGWRSAIADERLAGFRIEAVIAAIQDLGPRCDPLVLNPFILHVSDVITKILRRSVGHNFRNQGEDIINEVHGKLVSAMHDPTSKDGEGAHFFLCLTACRRRMPGRILRLPLRHTNRC